MSDVFYLNIPRSRPSIHPPSRSPAFIPDVPHLDANAAASKSVSFLRNCLGGGLSSLRAFSILSVGCVVCLAVRVWMQPRRPPPRRTGRRPKRRVFCGPLSLRAKTNSPRASISSEESGEGEGKPTERGASGNPNETPRVGEGIQTALHPNPTEARHPPDSPNDVLDSPNDGASVFTACGGHRYRRLSLLGRGGFGTVYKCMCLDTGQLVAVKEVRLAAPDSAAEVRREFDLLARLAHPNVVRVVGHDVGRRHARLLLEWAAGGSLREAMRAFGPDGLPEALVRRYAREILAALRCLHANGIVHRDVKPQNILIDHRGVLRVSDFGLSRVAAGGASVWLTAVAGTPRYMAPETIAGKCCAGGDLWSLGATMSELLTGKPPWSQCGGAEATALLFYIATHPDEHPCIPAWMSEAGKGFMAQCFRQDPRERGTAEDMLKHPFITGHAEGE